MVTPYCARPPSPRPAGKPRPRLGELPPIPENDVHCYRCGYYGPVSKHNCVIWTDRLLAWFRTPLGWTWRVCLCSRCELRRQRTFYTPPGRKMSRVHMLNNQLITAFREMGVTVAQFERGIGQLKEAFGSGRKHHLWRHQPREDYEIH